MPYATQQDLETRFGAAELEQLSDRDGTAGGIVAAVVEAALKDADELINAAVAGRYAVPLAPVPELVKRIACDLARYFLHGGAVAEVVEKNYTAAMNVLKSIGRGDMTLQCAGAATAEAPAGDYEVIGYTPPPVFTDAAMGDF